MILQQLSRKLILAFAAILLFTNAFSQAPLYSGVLVSDVGTTNNLGQANTSRNVAVDASGNIGVVYVGSQGLRFAKSTNRGQSFQPSIRLGTATSGDCEVEMADNGNIYIIHSVSNVLSLYISLDGGATFTGPNNLGSGSVPHIASFGSNVYVVPQQGNIVYRNANNGVGSFSSFTMPTSWAYADIRVDKANGDVYFIADNPTLYMYKSTNSGATFTNVPISGSVFYSSYTITTGPLGKFIYVGGSGTAGYRIDFSNAQATSLNLGNNVNSQGRTLTSDEFGNFVDGYASASTTMSIKVSQDKGATYGAAINIANANTHNIARNASTQDIDIAYQGTDGKIYLNVYPNLLRGLTCSGVNAFYCPGSNGTVNYSFNGATVGANNVYTVQLSDANRSFANPVNIGSLTSTATSGNINFTIPAGAASGNNYRIRVVSSNPATTGADNLFDIAINPTPVASVTASGATTICQGNPVILVSSAASTYSWSNGATTSSINVNDPGTYTVTTGNGCGLFATSAPITVNVTLAPTITANGPTSFCTPGSSVTLTSSPGSAYLWSTGATTQSINVTTAGNYTVKVTGGGCAITSAPVSVSATDNIPPTAIAKNIVVSLLPSKQVTVAASEVDNGSFDNCGTVSLSLQGQTTFGCDDLGKTIPVTLVVTDARGNTSNASANVTVADPNKNCNQPPVAVAKALVLNAGNDCSASAVAEAFNNGSSDPDGDALTFSVAPAAPYAIGTTNVVFTVTDTKGESVSVNTTVTVVDVTAPVVVNGGDVTLNNTLNKCSGNAVIPTLSISDNCAGIVSNTETLEEYPVGTVSNRSALWKPWPGGASALVSTEKAFSGVNSLKVTGVPAGGPVDQLYLLGNQTSGKWNISFKMFVPAGKTGYYNLQQDETPGLSFSHQVFFRSNGTGIFQSVSSNTNFSYPQDAWFPVQLIIDQDADQATAYINNVAVKTWQYSLNTGSVGGHNKIGGFDFFPATNNSTTIGDVNPSAQPLYYIDDIKVEGQAAKIGALTARRYSIEYPVGTTPVKAIIADVAGNKTESNFNVIVNDTQKPTVIPGANITVNNTPGACGATVIIPAPAVSDNCGIQSVTVSKAGFFPVGTTQITWTVRDIHNNVSTATQNITVVDAEAPSITAPANITVTANTGVCAATGVNLGTPVTGDNCGVASVMNDAPSSFIVGTTTVKWTVTDIHGNTYSALQMVTVTDDQNPTITAPANVTVSANAGVCAATNVALGNPATGDNCGVAGVTNNAPASYAVGTTVVTWTVTDIHGNSSTATQTVVVTDNEKPVITAPATLEVCDNNAGNTKTLTLAATDNCGISTISYIITGATTGTGTGNAVTANFGVGTSTITWTVTDIHDNVSTGSTTVIINGLPVVSVSSSNADAFCNATTVTATSTMAGSSFQWSYGTQSFAATQAISLNNSNADGVYSVYTTSDKGCVSLVPATYTYNKQNLISSYTILASKNVKLGYRNVVNGSVGVSDVKGKLEVKKYSSVLAPYFVKAANITVDRTAIATTQVNAPAVVTLPTMQLFSGNYSGLPNSNINTNTTLNGNYKDVKIKKGSVVTVTGSLFKSIEIEEGAKVTFTSSVLNIEDLHIDGGPSAGYTYVNFSNDASIRIAKQVKIDERVRFNEGGKKVTIYLGDVKADEEKFMVKGRDSRITANIYVPNGKIQVEGGCYSDDNDHDCDDKHHQYGYHDHDSKENCQPTIMTGIFIGESVESNGKNVIWNGYNCGGNNAMTRTVSPAIVSAPTPVEPLSLKVETLSAKVATELKASVSPNPTTTSFVVRAETSAKGAITIRIVDATGRVQELKNNAPANTNVIMGGALKAGAYFIEVMQGNNKQSVKAIKMN